MALFVAKLCCRTLTRTAVVVVAMAGAATSTRCVLTKQGKITPGQRHQKHNESPTASQHHQLCHADMVKDHDPQRYSNITPQCHTGDTQQLPRVEASTRSPA
jgi:hypothetical protein